MPFTFNGIGTHYYGAKNRSARVGVCQSCGRSATLSSYDTWEFFCVVFIPLIPLGKYRILNDCSSCRKHYRLRAKEFSQQVQDATAPYREAIRRSPRDPQPYVDLVQTLIGWEMRQDAERELGDALQLFPKNIDMTLLAAQMAVDRADYERALPLFESAHSIDPHNPQATYGYGWILNRLERHEQAVPVLQRAAAQEDNKIGATYLLAQSQMQLGRYNDALSAYQQVLSLEPAYAEDKALLRAIRECKQHLGYELTDAERRAGRNWWPFGRKKQRPVLEAQPTLVRPGLRIAGVVLAIVMVFSLGAVAFDSKTNIPVYFDNGLDRIVEVDVDGTRFVLGPQHRKTETMKEGQHTVVVRDENGKEIERYPFRLEELGFADAVMHDRFFVYNIGTQHVYRRAQHGYAKNARDSSYSDELIGMQRFFEQRDVDFKFEAAPEQIKTESRSSIVKKVSFTVAEDVDLATFALIRLGEGKTEEAKSAIDRAAANAPCNTRARRTQVALAGMAGTFEEAAGIARRWIADCAQDDLEAHRAYQDVYTENGRQAALREEYQKLIASSPESAKAHYLLGRVSTDPATAVAEHQAAIRLDPKLPWPRVALGHNLMEMERYDDALRELAAALDVEGRDPIVVLYYAMAAIAKGAPQEALPKLQEIRKNAPDDMSVVDALYLLSLATSDWQTVKDTQQILKAHESPQSTWWRETKMLRLQGDPSVDLRVQEALATQELIGMAAHWKGALLIEKGAYDQVAAALPPETDPATAAMMQMYAAGGLMLQGNRDAATKLLADAEAALAKAPPRRDRHTLATMIKALKGEVPVEAAITTGREANATRHAMFAAAVRAAVANDRGRAAQYLARAARASADLEFPHREVQAIAARLK